MSMLDDLAATKRQRPGPICVFQQARNEKGDQFLADTLIMLMAPGRYSSTQKAEVLEKHGYGVVDRQVIERHAAHRLWSLAGCRGCADWIDDHPDLVEMP